MSKALTPIAFVAAIAEAYQRRGMDPGGVLAQARIAPALLRRASAHISAAQMETVSAAAMRELDDEALGWFERRLPWGSYGMLARASLSAPTLGIAMARWCRHHALLARAVVIELHEEGAAAGFRLHEHGDALPPAMRELCLVTLLRNLHGVASWFVDSRISLRATRLPFAAPPHAEVYPLLFPGPVEFGAATAGFDFDAGYLALPLRRDERAMRAMLKHALPVMVRPYRRDRLLVRRVAELLAHDPLHMVDAAALARELHISPRTLHRQLQAEGASLQALKDEARRARAIELLERSREPIKRIAQACGFASEKSFARAFGAWTGMAPGAWRVRGGGA